MKSIGELYFDSSYFNDNSSLTIVKPELGNIQTGTTSDNRKKTNRLNERGLKELEFIKNSLNELFVGHNIEIKWNKYCGCSTCPCSPGYRVNIDKDILSSDKYRFSLRLDKKGKYHFKEPTYPFEIGRENVDKLKKIFS